MAVIEGEKQTKPFTLPSLIPEIPQPPPPRQPARCDVALMYEAWAQRKVIDWLEQANQEKTAFVQSFNFTRAYAMLFRQYLEYRHLYPNHAGFGEEYHLCLLRVVIDMGNSLDDMR